MTVAAFPRRAARQMTRLWRGEIDLFHAFWDWAVIGGLVVNISTTIAFLALVMNELPLVATVVGYALTVPYNLLVTVGVWRAAARYAGEPRWATLARAVTLIGMIALSVT